MFCQKRKYCSLILVWIVKQINFHVLGDYEEELQMAANDVGNFVSVEAPEGFKNYDSDVDTISPNNENIVSYDVDMDNSYNSEEYQIDWDTLFSVPDSSLQQ